MRNLVLAPITEEIVFRALMIPPLASAWYFNYDPTALLPAVGTLTPLGPARDLSRLPSPLTLSPWQVLLSCPAFFALAHLHHLYEKLRRGEGLVAACLGTLAQATYTSAFGVVAGLLFMRTGTVLAPIVSHVICNFSGLPDVGFVAAPPAAALRLSDPFGFLDATPGGDVAAGTKRGSGGGGNGGMRSEYSALHGYRHVLLALHAAGLLIFAAAVGPMTAHDADTSLYWNWGKLVL